MKNLFAALGVAVTGAAAFAPAAFAQVEPAPAAPRFAPLAMADLIDRVCRAAEKDGASVSAIAKSSGMGEPQTPPADLQRALPDSARTWAAPAVDGALYLFAYGEEPLKCGAVVLRPLPVAGFQLALEQFQAPARGFVIDSSRQLEGNVTWTRLKSRSGQYIDLMEYPADVGLPGVLRADLLPN